MKRFDFNEGWLFNSSKSISKTIDLPHDAMIEDTRSPNSPGGSGVAYFQPGSYVYEKQFYIPIGWQSKRVSFHFEGVYRNCSVLINGHLTGGRQYGYIPFLVEAGPLLKLGQENTIRVEVDNSQMPNSRWYSGAGIYRPVWLWVGEQSHIDVEGVKISTLSIKPARIRVQTAVNGGEIEITIFRQGQIVATAAGDDSVIDIPDASLWSDESPELYQCRVRLFEQGHIIDEVIETFGIRLIKWGAQGLFINGRETLLRGGCVHHDNGILGARAYSAAEARRVRLLKQAGFNAIRSSHNPASTAMLEACDRYGMYMIDETWDMWYCHKNKYDYAADFMSNYQTDIESLVKRDFNHPSVICYSIGNEVSEPHNNKGVEIAKTMVSQIHELDQSRAVTAGINLMIVNMAYKGKGIYKDEGGLAMEKGDRKQPAVSSLLFNMIASFIGTGMNRMSNSKAVDKVVSPVLDALDIAGYNYASGRYRLEGKYHPCRVIVGSETFPQDIAKNWGMVQKYPYLIGDFMWTAWDYLGEAGIGTWAYTRDGSGFSKPYPWLLADVGVIDILGHQGAQAAYAAIIWGKRTDPYMGVRPVNHPGTQPYKGAWRGTNALDSWSWQLCSENPATVEVYAVGASAALYLNGFLIGKKKLKQCKAIFKTRYAPGILKAVIYDNAGFEFDTVELSSAAGETRIRVLPESDHAVAGDIIYVNVDLVGANGVVESNADACLSVTVEGGELLAFGSANPRTEESYCSGSFTSYYGRALAVVRRKQAGQLVINVSGHELPKVSEIIDYFVEATEDFASKK